MNPVIGVCIAMVVLGLGLGVRWSGGPFIAPPTGGAPSAGEVARRYSWYVSLVLIAGVGAGLLVLGAGGRLAMRLLAVTAGDSAQGRITEAQEVVGRITVDGTIGFVVFNGVFGGFVFGALYLIARRWLPAGRIGGLAYGATLLVVLGTVIDPLRDDNPDFDIVGPGWLAVLVFTLLALAFGLSMAGFMARLSAWLPQPSWDRGVLVRYLPALLIASVGAAFIAFVAAFGLLVVVVSRWKDLVAGFQDDRMVLVGRIVLGAVVLVALPHAVSSASHIISR